MNIINTQGTMYCVSSFSQNWDCVIIITVEPLLKDPPRKGQPLYKGHFTYLILFYGVSTFSASDKRTASLQGTKRLAPKCPFL